MDLNAVNLTGRMTRDPDVKYTADGKAIANFGIAVKGFKDKTHFFDVSAFGKNAEFVEQYMRKGNRVGISGELNYETWESAGPKRSAVRIAASKVVSLEGRKTEGERQEPERESFSF